MYFFSRRAFLQDVGRGMLAASLGPAMTFELGLSPCLADEPATRLTFGALEPLVCVMQETAPDKLLPLLVEQLKSGTPLRQLVTAGALANARAFGGQDYTGYHTFMALLPAYQMSGELPAARQALPVLKVLYRNSTRIQEQNFFEHDTLHPVAADKSIDTARGGELLRESVRAVDYDGAEARFAAIAKLPAGEAFNHLQFEVQEEVNVHRVVLAWRAWAMLDLTGQEHAHSLLRQSLRFCLDSEKFLKDRNLSPPPVRDLLPRLMDDYGLMTKPRGNRAADDQWVEQFANLVFTGTHDQAAEAAAAALAEGIRPEDVAEGICLAANALVLYDPGRTKENSTPQKPLGCVHGDSVGVHASDSANAWRNIARVANPRNQIASLIVGAYHTAGQSVSDPNHRYPYMELVEEIQTEDGPSLLQEAEEAIRSNEQSRACAIVHRYGEHNLPPRQLFDLLLKYAVSEDGALHAEKYYRTVTEEFAATRPAFRWRQLVALARVTASEHGYPAPGVAQARELLGIA